MRIAAIEPLILSAFLACACSSRLETPSSSTIEWPFYGANAANTKYSPLSQIDAENVRQVRIAWRWQSIEKEILEQNPQLWSWAWEATPVMSGNTLYTSTSLSQVAALDAYSGETLWTYDPKSWENHSSKKWFIHRGVAYWEKGVDQRVFLATGDTRLIAIQASTGEPIPTFGDQGQIDLAQGLRRPVDRALYTMTSPPIVCDDVVVVGSSTTDFEPVNNMPPGDVRGFDARTGRLRWTFHSVPQEGEFGNNTWEDNSWQRAGNTNVWTLMSCDPKLGIVYLPFGTPNNDFFGGHRLGNNLYGESLVALEASTGKRRWHFQVTHHGLWDYDLPTPPVLIDITVDGESIPALAQVTKQGFVFVLNRETGQPVWPIPEQTVPQTEIPGERTAPTQPIPTRPSPFERQGVTPDALIDFTPELRQQALEILERYRFGPLYTPPSLIDTLVVPGWTGGASWAGAAFDPVAQVLYIPSTTAPESVRLEQPNPALSDMSYFGTLSRPEGPEGLPLFKPPYGRVTAIDLTTGEQVWVSPVGRGPVDHPLLKDLQLGNLGWPRRSFPLLTKTLLFIGQEPEKAYERSEKGSVGHLQIKNLEPSLKAFDPTNGSLIHEIPLPGNVTGSPMTYSVKGKQFIVLAIGGASRPAELIALALPD